MSAMMFNLAAMFGWFTSLQQWIASQLQHGSYVVLFGLLFSCGLGMPLPEDIPLLIAGAMIAAGKMNLAVACICAWSGIVGGDVVLYHIGRTFGLEVKKAPFIGRHLSEQRLEQVHGMFERWGVWAVAVGRMFAGLRGAMVFVAGMTRFTFWKFLVADGIAALFSGGLFIFLGYQFGKNMDVLRDHVEKAKKWSLVAVLMLAAGFGVWVYVRRRKYRADDQLEQDMKNTVPVTEEHG